MHELHEIVVDFLTTEVDLPDMPDVEVGKIWWEERNGWRYPWRVTGDKKGYPCGEPEEIAI